MSRRIFVNVTRGMTDKTAVCIYPWEVKLLEMVHGQEIREVSIDEMSSHGDGVIKVERQKLKHTKVPAPDLRAQFEIMAYVDPEDDPANDPAGEYNRLVDKYGMDKDLPIPVVTRVYGEFSGGGFERMLKEHVRDRMPKPKALKAADEGLDKEPKDMTAAELRAALDERGITWSAADNKSALIEKLEGALVE